MLDPKTKKYTFVATRFQTHHLQFGYDTNESIVDMNALKRRSPRPWAPSPGRNLPQRTLAVSPRVERAGPAEQHARLAHRGRQPVSGPARSALMTPRRAPTP